jgi:hypothetical protein
VKLARITPEYAVEVFIWSNLAFLGVDIALAHAENRFIRWEEWIPIVFSAIAALALIPGLVSLRLRAATRGLSLCIGGCSVLLGVSGLIYHLSSAFFERQVLVNLVYSAPFIAPLAYVGVGLLLVMSRMKSAEDPEWASWVLLFAVGGFVGNLGLCLLDHAQNGFARPAEWVSVGAAAFGSSFLLVTLLRPQEPRLALLTLAVLAAQVAIGVLGFGLHLSADLRRPGVTWPERLIHGAPVFAPLLFADLALLGAIGIWSRLRDSRKLCAVPSDPA